MDTTQSINFKQRLQNDDVYVSNRLASLATLTGLSVRKGLEKALISAGQIVNVVSDSYGHLPNSRFFHEVEVKLVDAGIGYVTRSINRDNRSFAVDYILSDDNWVVKVKNGMDKLRPMLRFTNSYDGSTKTSGHFGFFREVCSNGLHVSHSKIGFSVKHKGDIVQVVLPEIRMLVNTFLNNEFYSLHRKFEVLAERPISNMHDFVKVTAETFKLFKFECSEKNHDPSLNARMVIDTIRRESEMLGQMPTLWIGYNAFNTVLHNKLKKTFDSQKRIDEQIFTHLLETR
jgi:hypothetical protein